MQLPPFMGIEHDSKARKASLKVHDPDIRRQREMWGELATFLDHKQQSVDTTQVRPVPTFKTTFSAFQKVILPFYAWSESATELRSSRARSPYLLSIPGSNSCRSRLDIHIQSNWVYLKVSRLVRHNRLASY